jgi:O-antigen/teichoic acid export membrane protein
MRKQLLRDSAVYISGSMIVHILGFIGLVYLMRFLPVTEYGKYIYIIEFISIFGVFSDGGFTKHIVKESCQKPDLIEEIYLKAQSAQILFSVFMLLLILMISYLTNSLQDFYYISIFGISVVISAFFAPMLAILIASGRKDLIFYKDLTSSIFKLGFILCGIYFKAPLTYFIYLGFINCFVLFVLFIYTRYKKEFLYIFRLKIDLPGSLTFIRQGVLFTVFIAANIIYTKIDIIMLEKIVGSTEVGFYSGATRFIYPFLFISDAFMTAIFPTLAKHANNKKEFKKVQDLATYYLGGIGVLLSVSLFFSADFIFLFFFDHKYDASIPVFKVMVWYIAIVFVYGSISNNLVAKNRIKFLVYLNLMMIILNVVLNFLLIPGFGAKGSAIATIICEILILISAILYWRKTEARDL